MSFHSFDQEKFDRWKAALTRAHHQPGWNQYDADLQHIVSSFDRFNSPKGGYVPPRWELMKALLWVEGGGPGQKEAWAHMPMQIGVRGDPGIIDVVTSPHVALVAAPEMRRNFDAGTIRVNPVVNIAAGMTLLHLKMAYFSKRPKPKPSPTAGAAPTASATATAMAGAMAAMAAGAASAAAGVHSQGKTREHTPHAHPEMETFVSGWRPFNPITLYQQYNIGDGAYAAKLRFCLELIEADNQAASTGDK